MAMDQGTDPAFDTDLFIEAIEQRRSIWDLESPDYKNRVLKRSAWEEVVDMFSKNESTIEQKKQLGLELQKRWKNLRDSFAREMRKRKYTKSGSGAVKGTPYVYFQRLNFLENTVRNKETTSNLDESGKSQSPEEEEVDNEDLVEPIASATVPRKKIKLNPVDQHFSDILTKSMAARQVQQYDRSKDDEDKLFCLSLYKELQKVPEHGRIRTKIQLLEVIQRAQDFYNPLLACAPQVFPPTQASAQQIFPPTQASAQQVFPPTQASAPHVFAPSQPTTAPPVFEQSQQNLFATQIRPHYINPYGQGTSSQTPNTLPANSPAGSVQSSSSDYPDLYN